jgi:hypothetical protein
MWIEAETKNPPNTLQVHRSDFHHMADFLAFENAITSTPSHAGDVEQLRAIDHVIIWGIGASVQDLGPEVSKCCHTFSPRDTDPLGLDLEAKTALIFP